MEHTHGLCPRPALIMFENNRCGRELRIIPGKAAGWPPWTRHVDIAQLVHVFFSARKWQRRTGLAIVEVAEGSRTGYRATRL